MKRLFTVDGEHYATKMEAKAARGAPTREAYVEKVNGRDVHYPPTYKFQIKLGPDHIGKHGDPRCTQSRHRAPQQGFARKED